MHQRLLRQHAGHAHGVDPLAVWQTADTIDTHRHRKLRITGVVLAGGLEFVQLLDGGSLHLQQCLTFANNGNGQLAGLRNLAIVV